MNILIVVLLMLSTLVINAAIVTPKSITTIEKGIYSGIDYATNTVIKSKEDWDKLWKKHQSKNIPPEKSRVIDFDKDMVIVATMGNKHTGGYEVKINGIEYNTDTGTMTVSVFHGVPNPDAIVTQGFTQPYHFVVVPKNDLKVRFMIATP
jgi:hypothetical protein